MVRTSPSIEHIKRCYNAMKGGTDESYTIPRKKKTSAINDDDSFLTFDGGGCLDVLENGLGDFAAASGVDGQDCDGVSLISLEELGDFDAEEAVPFLNSMDELLDFDQEEAALLASIFPSPNDIGDTTVNTISVVETIGVFPKKKELLVNKIAYLLTYFHGGSKCKIEGCGQLCQLNGCKQSQKCRLHNLWCGVRTNSKEVLSSLHCHMSTLSGVLLKEVESLEAVSAFQRCYCMDDVATLFGNFNEAVGSIEEKFEVKLPLTCNLNSMVLENLQVTGRVTSRDIHTLILGPALVHFLMQAVRFPKSKALFREILAKVKACNLFHQDGFVIHLSREVKSKLQKINALERVENKLSSVVWSCRFILDCVDCAEAFNIVDAFINLCKSTMCSDEEDIIRVMAALGFQLNFLARFVASHARECSVARQTTKLFAMSRDRLKSENLKLAVLMALCKDMLETLFNFGFFPGVNLSDEVLRHSSEFCELMSDRLRGCGQLNASVSKYVGAMLRNVGLASSSEQVDVFRNLLMNRMGDGVYKLPLFFAAYVGLIAKCVLRHGNLHGPFMDRLVKQTGGVIKLQLVKKEGDIDDQSFNPASFTSFSISHSIFETRLFMIGTLFFQYSSFSKQIAVDMSWSVDKVKIFSLNVTDGLDICSDGIDPRTRIAVITSMVSNITHNMTDHAGYISPILMGLIRSVDLLASSGTGGNVMDSNIEDYIAKIICLLDKRLETVGRRAGVGQDLGCLDLSCRQDSHRED